MTDEETRRETGEDTDEDTGKGAESPWMSATITNKHPDQRNKPSLSGTQQKSPGTRLMTMYCSSGDVVTFGVVKS